MSTGLQLPFGIDPVNPKPVDAKQYNNSDTIYANTAEVIAQVPSAIRFIGRTFFVNNGSGGTDEFWFKNGIADGDLVKKSGGFELEVDVALSGSVTVNTLVSSSLQWDSTVSSVIHMDYFITEDSFGSNTLKRTGHLTIIVSGNNSSSVFIGEDSVREVSATQNTNTIFDVDVNANMVRLLYTNPVSNNIGARFFNITRQVQINVGSPGGE